MSKGLEAIQEYKRFICPSCQYYYGGKCNSEDECFSTVIEKELKVLEIIKNKIIDIQDVIVFKTYASFNQRRTLRGLLPISKKEYDLLKEILCDIK